MFCSKCGKEIADGTMFCNFCGAAQNGGVAPQPQQPQQVQQAPKKNKTGIIIVAAVAIVVIVVGAIFVIPSITDKEKPEDTTPVITENVGSVDTPTADTPTQNEENVVPEPNAPLVDLTYGNQTGKRMECTLADGGYIQISFGYDSVTGLVNQLTASFNINDKHPEYESLKDDFNTSQNKAKTENDNSVSIIFNQLSDSVTCICSFQNLTSANREKRVEFAAEELDLPINEKDYAFYIDEVTDALTQMGFTEVQ